MIQHKRRVNTKCQKFEAERKMVCGKGPCPAPSITSYVRSSPLRAAGRDRTKIDGVQSCHTHDKWGGVAGGMHVDQCWKKEDEEDNKITEIIR